GDVFPHIASAPFVLPAGTDARHLTEICPCVIRFAPIDLDKQQFASVHSENENIDVHTIANAVEFYKTVVRNYK
ncbi:MAG: M20/M25/M40 family metallo-hydrolase, partial [Oscillospiraceae bacterium]